jgi:hypothetical protein
MIENRGDADPGERGEHDDARHHPSPAAGSDALPSRLLSLDGGFLLAAALLPQFPSSFAHDRHSYLYETNDPHSGVYSTKRGAVWAYLN